jgi:hypothetical protein
MKEQGEARAAGGETGGCWILARAMAWSWFVDRICWFTVSPDRLSRLPIGWETATSNTSTGMPIETAVQQYYL